MKMKRAASSPANEGSLARPKRPLSAFNLFYRFKRQHVTDAIALGMADREAILALMEALPGLERCPPGMIQGASPEEVTEIRRHSIRKVLLDNLLPRDTRDRSHRKDRDAMNGAMGFVELAGVMRSSWKACDELAKEVFQELSDEGRKIYVQRVKEWKNATSRELALRELADKHASSKQPPGEQSPGEQSPGEQPLGGQPLGEQSPGEQPPCEQPPCEQPPEAGQPSAKPLSSKPSSAEQSPVKCSPAEAPPVKPAKECSLDEEASPDLTLKDNSQDGGAAYNTKEGQPANKTSGAKETSPSPISNYSHSEGGGVIRTAGDLLRKRSLPEPECAARGPSNSHSSSPSCEFTKRDVSNGGSGAPPGDLCSVSMDCRPFQEKFIKMRQDESCGSNGAPPNDMRDIFMDRCSFKGTINLRNSSMDRKPFQGGGRFSNCDGAAQGFSFFKQGESSVSSDMMPNNLLNASRDCGPFQGNSDPRNASMGSGPFQDARHPMNSRNDAVDSSFFRQGAAGGNNGSPFNNPFIAGSLSFKQDACTRSNIVSPSYQRNVIVDGGTFQASGPPGGGGPNEVEERLQARVRELEAQLTTERLRARVRELEGELKRQRMNEDLVTRQLEVLSRSVRASSSMDGRFSAQNGCLPLLSAIPKMSEVRNIPSAVQQHTMQLGGDGPSNKRQRSH